MFFQGISTSKQYQPLHSLLFMQQRQTPLNWQPCSNGNLCCAGLLCRLRLGQARLAQACEKAWLNERNGADSLPIYLLNFRDLKVALSCCFWLNFYCVNTMNQPVFHMFFSSRPLNEIK